MGRHSLAARLLACLRDGFCNRRDLAMKFGITAGEVDESLAPHVASGSVVLEARSSGRGRAMSVYRLSAQGARKTGRRQDRPCLKCGSLFASEGPHNRICTRCKGSADWQHGASLVDTPHVVRYR